MQIDVTIKWSKGAPPDSDIRKMLAQPMAIAEAAAKHISRRVQSGQTATPAQPFSDRATAGPRKHKSFYISPAYAERAGLGVQTKWRSSLQMHQAVGAVAGAGKVTGQMWRGLQVRNFGDESAVIEFGGSSLGTKSTRSAVTKRVAGSYEVTLSDNGKLRAKQVRELSRDEGGAVKYRRKPRLEQNRVKAAAVFRHSKVGVLQPTDPEQQAMWQAFVQHADIIVRGAFGAAIETPAAVGDTALFGATLRSLQS